MLEHFPLGLFVRLVRPVGLVLAGLALAAPVSLRAQEPESVRVATFNAYLLSPIFKCANAQFADCLLQINGKTEAQAKRLADTILKDPDRFDIIAINEAWDEDAKQILVDKLKSQYPNYVRKIDADLIQLRGATLQAILNGMNPAAAVAIYGLPIEKINGEDSGLMLFANAKFKFLPLPEKSFKWGDDKDEALEAETDEVGFTLFEPCAGVDCLSGKGAAIVRLRHLPSQHNYTVVFSHMQADYFDKTPPEINAAAREGQFAQVEKLIETTLSPLSDSERRQERVLMMGDLNVPLFHQPAGEWAGRSPRPAPTGPTSSTTPGLPPIRRTIAALPTISTENATTTYWLRPPATRVVASKVRSASST
jgi:hypothetical protein